MCNFSPSIVQIILLSDLIATPTRGLDNGGATVCVTFSYPYCKNKTGFYYQNLERIWNFMISLSITYICVSPENILHVREDPTLTPQ